MKFIDNNGHIFTINSYNEFPVGYEYEENHYIFWINKEHQNHLSINNYYAKVINILIPLNENESFDDLYNITININSEKFSLINSANISEYVNNIKDINDYINIENKKDITNELHNNDLFCVKTSENHCIVPLYVIGISDEEGSWYTNILITLENKIKNTLEYCYITVGGEFIDEYEQLIINGKNMGVNLPKDIIKAVYEASYYNDQFNTDLYNQKLKEYLLNYMGIRGELGNFNSVENSIKWFGWNNYISISKLLQTDNQFKNQFIRDYFNINNDLLESFSLFRNSTYISLFVDINKETGKLLEYNYTNIKNGESNTIIWDGGEPELESLLNKIVLVEGNGVNYFKGYFDYNFTELGLKLACFKFFLNKYFLPIHLSIMSMGMNFKVYTNDIKVGCYDTGISISAPLVEAYDKNVKVKFNENEKVFIQTETHIVDSNFNEFNWKGKYDKYDLYEIISETCINIPIYFKKNNLRDNDIYNCKLILSKEKDKNEFGYYIDINYLINLTDNINIYDINNEKIDLNKVDICYSYDSKIYTQYYTGLNNLFDAIYKLNSYRFDVYYNKSEDNKIIFNFKSKNDILYGFYFDCIWDDDKQSLILNEYIKYSNYILNIDLNELNKIYTYIKNNSEVTENFTNSNFSINIVAIKNFYIRIKYNTDKISKVLINSLYLDEYYPILNSVYVLHESYTTETSTHVPSENVEINNKFYWVNGPLFEAENEDYLIILEESKGYEVFNEDLVSIKFLPTAETIFESSFIFSDIELFDNNDNWKYMNFIISPKFITDNPNEADWINNNFKISLLVNGVWYYYNFNTDIIGCDLEIGKLEYKYFENEDIKNTSYFKQLSYLSSDKMIFNNYMHPASSELSLINHNNFYNDYIEYYTNSNLKYFDGNTFINEDFYYNISYNGKTINIHYNNIGKNLKYNPDNIGSEYCYLQVVNVDNRIVQIEQTTNDIYNIEEIADDSNIITFYFNEDRYQYSYTYLDNNVISYSYLDINTTLNYNLNNSFLNKYISEKNISNNKKYYNNIYLFDLYKKEKIYEEEYIFVNKSFNEYKSSSYDISMSFKNYIYDVNKDPITYIQLKSNIENITEINSISTNSEAIELMYRVNGKYMHKNCDCLYTCTCTPTPTDFIYDVVETSEIDNDFSFSYYSYNKYDIVPNNTTYTILGLFCNGENTTSYVECANFIEYNFTHINYKHLIDIKENINNSLSYSVTYNENYYTYLNKNYIIYTYNNRAYLGIFNNNFANEYYPYNYNKIIIKDEDGNILHRYDLNGTTLNTLISYNFLTIENLYFNSYFYKIDNDNLVEITNSKEYNDLYKIYWNEDYKSNYVVKYDFSKNKSYKKYFDEIKFSDIRLVSNPNNVYKNLRYKYDENGYTYFYDYDNRGVYTYIDNGNEIKKLRYINNFYIENISINSLNCNKKLEFNIYKDGNLIVNTDKTDLQNSYMYISYNDKNHKIYINEPQIIDCSYYSYIDVSFFIDGNISYDSIYTIYPRMYSIKEEYVKYKYDPEEKNNRYITFKIGSDEYKFGDNRLDLYNGCFLYKENNYNEIKYNIIEEKEEIKLNHTHNKYDFYLMHDNDYWYGMYISQNVLSNFNYNDIIISDKDKTKYFKGSDDVEYMLKYYKSDQQMLLNRMNYVPSNGNNIFNTDDIIVISSIKNNTLNKFPINIFNKQKWEIEPYSIGIPKINISGNNEMFIMDIPTNKTEYYKGYYDIILKYNIDNYNQHRFEKTTKILIK